MCVSFEAVFAFDIREKLLVAGCGPRFDLAQFFLGRDELLVRQNVVFLGRLCQMLTEQVPAGEDNIFVIGEIGFLEIRKR